MCNTFVLPIFVLTTKEIEMSNFNNKFYSPNTSYTREDAEKVMKENGYTDFQFKSCSFSNGASFYFDVNGKEIRVSDHPLTGKRAFNTIQLSLLKKSVIKANIKKEEGVSDMMKRVYKAMLDKGAITLEVYNEKIKG